MVLAALAGAPRDLVPTVGSIRYGVALPSPRRGVGVQYGHARMLPRRIESWSLHDVSMTCER
jgi:hypothetical protein